MCGLWSQFGVFAEQFGTGAAVTEARTARGDQLVALTTLGRP
jgi:hypothetical protein